jgi:hypothetical protein
MISNDYFENQLGDIHNLAIIKIMNGVGILYGKTSNPVEWALCVEITGKKHLIIESKIFGRKNFDKLESEYRLEGNSIDGEWNIQSNKIFILSEHFLFDENKIISRCEFNKLSLSKNYTSLSSVKAYITNFDFRGLENSNYENRYVRDKFNLSICNRLVQFKLLENLKQIRTLLNSERISIAIMSTVSFEIKREETVEDIAEMLTNILLFLSSLSLNLNFAPIVEYYSNDQLVMIEIEETSTSKYNGDPLIDNYRIPSGIKNAFEKSFHKFLDLKEDLELYRFTQLIVELYQQKYIELKIATLIIIYEHLLLRYLISSGYVNDINEEINIQQKLGRVNKELKFIPKNLMSDEFRHGIRNSLFHTGSISTKSFEELQEIYGEYLDLIMRIYLRILNYDGYYISRKNYSSVLQV